MRILLVLFFLSVNIFAVDATLKIEKDVDSRAHIAVLDCSDTLSLVDNAKIFEIVSADLKISGHFLPDREYRRGSFAAGSIDPSLKAFRYVLRYRFSIENGGRAAMDVRLYEGGSGRALFEKKYEIALFAKYPFVIHRAVADINKRAGYASIEWINRYVVFARSTGKKKSEIVIADYTFNYLKTIIRGGLNLFPKWADKEQHQLYYTSYEANEPALYRLNIYTGERSRILSSPGMLICSDVSRDGKRLLLTMAPGGQPDIYEYDTQSGSSRRLTSFSGIDVGGKYAEGERTLVFISNRLGYPNVFKKPVNGAGAIEPLVYHGRNNNSCDVYGNRVVYSSREKESSFGRQTFNLYLTRIDGSGTRPLTAGGVNQFPRFSPDGNTVLYLKRDDNGTSVGYIGVTTNQSMLFPIGTQRVQSFDW